LNNRCLQNTNTEIISKILDMRKLEYSGIQANFLASLSISCLEDKIETNQEYLIG
jgi:hypothetical protein